MIYQKLLRLGAAYNRQVQTSEVVQVAVEGIDQLETYFGAYLPQFFYMKKSADRRMISRQPLRSTYPPLYLVQAMTIPSAAPP